ncbi:MAG: hypothetical protein OEX00_08755 [Gammaproteobacteria bacterium]|nr:hypothetical protein [Gammaproteobacteria bacterium]
MYLVRSLVFLNILLAACSIQAASVFVKQENWHYSGSTPLEFFDKGWSIEPVNGADYSEGYSVSQTGVEHLGFRFGVIQKAEVSVSHSKDFIDLLYSIKREDKLTIGRNYQLEIDANVIRATGLLFGYRYSTENWGAISVSYSQLESTEFYYGSWKGHAQSIAENDYDFRMDVDYYYQKDVLFDRKIEMTEGGGYTIDLEYRWESDQLDILLRLDNVTSKIVWPKAPHTKAVADNNTKEYNENGYVIFRPLLNGNETNDVLAQQLPKRTFLNVDFVELPQRLFVHLLCTPFNCYPKMGAGYSWRSSLYRVSYEPITESVGFGIEGNSFSGLLSLNNTPKRATSVSVLLGLNLSF